MTRFLPICLFGLALLALLAQPAYAQSPTAGDGRDAWSDVTLAAAAAPAPNADDPLPSSYRLLALDRDALAGVLAAAPAEGTLAAADATPLLLALPLPDGSYARFTVERSPVLDGALAAQHPEMQTWRARGVDDPDAGGRLGLTPSGFHAVILSADDAVFITPTAGGSPLYMSYRAADMAAPADYFCAVGEGMRPSSPNETDSAALRAELGNLAPALAPAASAGSEIRTYRLALAATAEFAADAAARIGLNNPTAAQLRAAALDAVTARANMVNALYEREVSIHFNLVAGNEQLIFTDAASDPYTDSRMDFMLAENQVAVDAVIGSSGYDIGHVLGTAGGGIAYLGVTCHPTYKAGGVSGAGAAVSAYATMVTAHEMGHQFDAGHTFNANSGACGGGNRMAEDAYEPGSGSTIMSYAGLCGAEQNLPGYNTLFHVVSFDEIIAYSRGGYGSTCGSSSATTNHPPTVEAGPDHTIPARTPFVLSGNASDADGDPLVYGWQQVDVGRVPISGTATLAEALTDWGSGPLYRVQPFAAAGATRAFPSLANVLAGSTQLGEVYPATTRTLTFRLFARDDQVWGGGAGYDTVQINVLDTGAAFRITQPDAAAVWPGGLERTVAWNVAGTDAAPVACPAVDILFSDDDGGGFAPLLQATPNDGSQPVTLPAAATTAARIEVRCTDNIFYNISPAFTVRAPGQWGALAGTVRSAAGDPIVGANIAVSGAEAVTVTSGAGGAYSLQLLAGGYTATANAYGYNPAAAAVTVSDGVTTALDLTLTPLAQQVISGTVRDAGHGYPLYATLTFSDGATGAQVGRVWSDPVTGAYSATLYTGIAYRVGVVPWLAGYAALDTTLDAGSDPADFVLAPAGNCTAPGYRRAGSQCAPTAGGLLVGVTYGPGAAGRAPLAGVRVSGGSSAVTSTVTTDPSVPDAFYSLFLPPGSRHITATGVYSGSALPALGDYAIMNDGAVTQYDFDWQPIFVDAHLGDLLLSSGQLTPPFTGDVLTYTAAVEGSVSAITVLPVTFMPGARVAVNGMSVISGIPSPSIPLAVGENTITVVVTALDGTTRRTYTVVVTRPEPTEVPLYLPFVRA